jgi:hypothetical protein
MHDMGLRKTPSSPASGGLMCISTDSLGANVNNTAHAAPSSTSRPTIGSRNRPSSARLHATLAPRASFSSRNRSYLLTAILACRSVGRTIGNGGVVTTSFTQTASGPLKYEVSVALRNASMLGCSVPEAALVKPGSSNMTHDPWSISARLRETSGLSVFTRISVPARTVL